METVDVKEFTKQLIADRCSMLIENEHMLPENVLSIIKRAHKEYKESPNERNFNNIKELISQTKYVEESVEYKNFNRGIFLIAMNLIVSKFQDVFPHYKPFFVNAAKRLEKVNPDMKSSPKAMLQHYHQCIEEMENPKPDDHYMISFAKEIVTKIFYDAVADMTNVGGSAVVIAPLSKELVLNKATDGGAARKKLVTLKKREEIGEIGNLSSGSLSSGNLSSGNLSSVGSMSSSPRTRFETPSVSSIITPRTRFTVKPVFMFS